MRAPPGKPCPPPEDMRAPPEKPCPPPEDTRAPPGKPCPPSEDTRTAGKTVASRGGRALAAPVLTINVDHVPAYFESTTSCCGRVPRWASASSRSSPMLNRPIREA